MKTAHNVICSAGEFDSYPDALMLDPADYSGLAAGSAALVQKFPLVSSFAINNPPNVDEEFVDADGDPFALEECGCRWLYDSLQVSAPWYDPEIGQVVTMWHKWYSKYTNDSLEVIFNVKVPYEQQTI